MHTFNRQALAGLVVSLPLLLPMPSVGAENTLNGRVTLGQEYNSNIYRDATDEVSEWTSIITPSLTYTRAEPTNTFTFQYAPSATYHNHTDTTRVNQFAAASYNHSLTRTLIVHLQDTFVLADDPYTEPTTAGSATGATDTRQGIRMADSRGRNRYWTNNFNTGLDYEYALQSFVKLSYHNQVLDNDDEAYADFVRHSPGVSVLHRFDQQWSTQVDYSFTQGDFDELATDPDGTPSEDLTTHAADLYLNYNLTPATKYFGHYGYSQTDYDELKEDFDVHTIAVGTNHQYSPTLNLGLEGGVSLLQRDASSDTEALFVHAALNKTWERSNLALTADSGLDEQQFSGTDQQGLSRYWAVGTTLNHTLLQNVTGTIGLLYREDTFLERTPEEKEQQLQADAALAYAFAQWYEISLRYTYVDHSADLALNEYDDHRILLQVAAAKDLLKW